MTDTYFPDISVFQPHADVPGIRKQTDVIAARLSYGTAADKMMPQRLTDIRAQNFKVVLLYVFMTMEPWSAQLSAIANLVGNLQQNEFIVVDWESYKNSQPSTQTRDLFLAAIHQRFIKVPVLYMAASQKGSAPGGYPLWLASYGTNKDPGGLIWQYTDGQYTSGPYAPRDWAGAGKCDTSVFHNTSDELLRALGGAPDPIGQAMQGFPNAVNAVLVPGTTNQVWVAGSDGGVGSYGGATFFGSMGGKPLNAPVVAIVAHGATGYWLLAKDGGIFAFGSAEPITPYDRFASEFVAGQHEIIGGAYDGSQLRGIANDGAVYGYTAPA